MSNTFGRDILIQAEDPMEAASFYVKELGFEITSETLNMVSLHGTNINLFIERGPYPWTRAGSYCRECTKSEREPEEKGLRDNKGRAGVSKVLRQGSERADL
jgi:hypothetical protein